jgi:aminomuconate-semialdehyde/2-hydroxymuconate-6-semialdehyde dehydrogenase
MGDILNYIDGRLQAPADGELRDNHEPATGKPYSRVPESTGADVEAAVAAAGRAFPGWSTTPAAERAAHLQRLADLVQANAERLAAAESRDNGKPLSLARAVDIPRASANLRFYAAAATQFASESHAMEQGAINYTLRQPLGVVACISPWNLPLYLFTWKIAPALAAGNCVVGKPSEVTPMTAHLLSELCLEAGLPPGVLNVLHGSGPSVGVPLVEHPQVKAISFTGGTATGADIAARAAPRFKKLSLELGGKNPTIVFSDCDWGAMLDGTVRAAFSNQGQICLCGSRILVQAPVYERFLEQLVERARSLRVGDPLEESTQQGAVVSRQHMDKILAAVQGARQDGGSIHCGGERVTVGGRCAEGWFVSPAVVSDLAPSCAANQREIFGPVVTVMPFDDEQQALQIANGTAYGLAASIWSRDIDRCHRLAAAIHSGVVWVNTWMLRDLRTPFGGMKDSGVGREGGHEALRFFTDPKNVCVQYGRP